MKYRTTDRQKEWKKERICRERKNIKNKKKTENN